MITDKMPRGITPEVSSKQTINYSEAIRLLKNTDALLEKRKKQMRVQAMKAQKGNWMEETQAKKQKIRQESKVQNQKTAQAYQQMKRKQLLKIEQLRKKGQQARKESMMNRSKSRMQAFQNKLRIKEQIRMKSHQHDQRIKSFRQETIDKKKSKCLQLYQQMKSSRMHVNDLQQSHVSQIRRSISRDRDSIMEKIQRKKKELARLNVEDSNQQTSPQKEQSISDLKSKQTLPYRQTSYLRNRRRKSISEARFDSNKKAIVY